MPQIISRVEAVAAGLTRYFTGKPCPKGHIAERQITGKGSECLLCKGMRRHSDYYAELEQSRERERKRAAELRATDPERCREYGRRADARNRHRNRESVWKQLGIRSAVWTSKPLKWPEFIEKIYEQQGVCWGCGKLLNPHEWDCVADHCHDTGVFRHVLCRMCNMIEGVASSPLIDLFREDTAAFRELYSW